MAAQRGSAWARLSKRMLADGPACVLGLPGCTGRATSIDHIVPLVERPDLEFEPSNLQPACQHCNSAKEIRRRHRPERRQW